MAKPNFTLPNKPAIKSGSILSYNYTDDFTFVPAELSFSRNGDATIVNSKNLIETVSANTPRIDYSDSLTEPSLLLEPQSTNKLTYSENFSQWIAIGSPTIESGYLAPNGNLNATKVTRGSNSTPLRKGTSNTLNTEHTFTIYAKKGNYNQLSLDIGDETAPTFTLTDEWQRFEVTSTPTTYNHVDIILPSSSSGDFIYIWGAQLEALLYPTSYIHTAGSTATRLGETANNAGDVNVFNSEEGVLYAEIAALANDGTNRRISINDGTISNRLVFQYRSTSNEIVYYFIVSGVNQCNMVYTLSDATQFNKIALKYKTNDFAIWVNGNEVTTDTSGSTLSKGTFNTLDFDGGTGSYDFYGKVKNVQVFNKALTDRELEILTIQ